MGLQLTGMVEHISIVTDSGRRMTFTLEDMVALMEQAIPLLVERGWEFAPCEICGSVTDKHHDELCFK